MLCIIIFLSCRSNFRIIISLLVLSIEISNFYYLLVLSIEFSGVLVCCSLFQFVALVFAGGQQGGPPTPARCAHRGRTELRRQTRALLHGDQCARLHQRRSLLLQNAHRSFIFLIRSFFAFLLIFSLFSLFSSLDLLSCDFSLFANFPILLAMPGLCSYISSLLLPNYILQLGNSGSFLATYLILTLSNLSNPHSGHTTAK